LNEFFQKLGWVVIDTETLTFAQEIELFANAEAFAGVLGSGFTNAIWSRPGCKVITFVADNWVTAGSSGFATSTSWITTGRFFRPII